MKASVGVEAVAPLLDKLEADFNQHAGLARWLVELRADIIENLELLGEPPSGDKAAELATEIAAEERYAVNLLVDHGDDPHPQVVVEPNPSYENLFGTIEYRSVNGVAETDFTLIRAGALHRANGSVLVLRADAMAQRGEAWGFLKAALRDGVIRIEELHRQGGMPMAGAPQPKPIPLQVKVVIVGAPRWYYTFFSSDPDFTTYFKVKADIDPDMPADESNLRVYAGLIDATARRYSDGCDKEAMQRLLGEASRWAADRRKLSARYELVEDVIAEAAAIASRASGGRRARRITAEHVRRALDERRQRNARVEDRSHEQLRDGVVMIDTAGARIGQINALTIRDLGDYDFGLPSRVTARVFVGRHGIVNIERSIEMGGPIQQKGVFIIGGYLNGRFARSYPLSFSATLTFEQNYGGVEGDSASMGELLAILSALSDVPLRQDIAITGSVNQNGESQAVAGVSRKVEGFYRTCAERGLTGSQGVLIPAANERNLVLSEEVTEAIADGRFHVWSMRDVDDALELLTGLDPGRPDRSGAVPTGSVAARIHASLDRFDAIMRERASLWN
jgi:predicted ATP-dependent protease